MKEKVEHPIGGLNGGWSVLFRIALASFPIFATSAIAWGTWVTVNILRHDEKLIAPHFTLQDAVAREAETNERFRAELKEARREIIAEIRGFR